ncbi:MAG: response regulator [Deltaproteobacteria bacterium]|nr:MAG: response regulator [Deltaproteobacteria bacterium]
MRRQIACSARCAPADERLRCNRPCGAEHLGYHARCERTHAPAQRRSRRSDREGPCRNHRRARRADREDLRRGPVAGGQLGGGFPRPARAFAVAGIRAGQLRPDPGGDAGGPALHRQRHPRLRTRAAGRAAGDDADLRPQRLEVRLERREADAERHLHLRAAGAETGSLHHAAGEQVRGLRSGRQADVRAEEHRAQGVEHRYRRAALRVGAARMSAVLKTAPRSRVLVVDDDPEIVTFLATLLELEGIESQVATSAAAALSLLDRGLPSLVLLDIAMPDRDGLDLCRALKKDPRTRDVPVFVVSARPGKEGVHPQAVREPGIDRPHLRAPQRLRQILPASILNRAGAEGCESASPAREQSVAPASTAALSARSKASAVGRAARFIRANERARAGSRSRKKRAAWSANASGNSARRAS